MSQPEKGPTLFYIMGAGRCGSTILSIILGSHPDIEAVGEIKGWPRHRGLPRDLDEKDEDCKFWKNVLEEYTDVDGCLPDFDELCRIYNKIEPNTKLLTHLFWQEKFKGFTQVL